jgi:ubiquinone/menaquinone biosynthesis C-methylase UbiE
MTVPAEVAAETARVRRLWDKSAAGFDKSIGFYERWLFAGGREWACSQAAGDVLEVGIGTGRNLAYYPPGVRLVGIELSEEMPAIAKRRAEDPTVEADLRLGDAQELDLPDESFDAVICTLSLCSIPDDRRAVQEAWRVLRPGGRMVLMEHVRSPVLPVRLVQTVLDWITVRTEGDHQLREPVEHLEAAGFEVEFSERLKWGIVRRVTARKPGK